MGKGKKKMDVDGPSRERIWDEEHSKHMLDWYIEYKKNQHAGFVWKKAHHMKCADALNKESGMGVTVAQVDWHYRNFKEKWKIVERTLNNSGNGFDVIRCKVTVSESEKANLNDRARRLLSKPIKFFPEMKELFQGSNADGSLAMDQETCMDDDEDFGSDDSGQINDISSYAKPVDIASDDSDTLPSTKRVKTSPNSVDGGENTSSNTCQSDANRQRPRGNKSPSKKAPKGKSRLSEVSEVIHTTLLTVAKSFAEPPPPPPVPKLDNPYANLWKRLEALPLPTNDKISVGVYLARPECEGMRSFLMLLLIQLWTLGYTNSYATEMASDGS